MEAGESCFGVRRVRGACYRGARGKIIVFGLLKRVGKVCTQVVPDVSRRMLMQAIEGGDSRDSIMHIDGFVSCDGLVDRGYRHHYRMSRS